MKTLYTIAATIGLGATMLATTATAGDTWEYKEERASVLTRDGELESRSRQGWRLVDAGDTDDGHLLILGRSATAATGRDAERTFVFKRTKLADMVADLDAMGKDGYTLDTIVSADDDDGYQAVFSRSRDARSRTGLGGNQWVFKLVDIGNGSQITDLHRAGDDGWLGLELLREGNSVYVLMVRDAGPGQVNARYSYEYRRVLGSSKVDMERAAAEYDIVAMVPDGAELGLLLRRDRNQATFKATYEYQLLDGGNRASDAERALNTAGADGWKLLDIDEDNRAIRLLMRRPKGN